MDPTTLMTFLFKSPLEVRTVELLGSWDNFTLPYRMHHDRRRGQGFYSGCFKFHNIIFDGDSSSWTKPRTGGLKQGGTYWYYFRLNDEVEAYDDSRDCTTGCPLLPGQTVNMVDVPIEVVDPPTRCRSASVDVAHTLASLPSSHTLEPGDKFLPLVPPPVSNVHGRCISDLAVNGRLENKAQSLCSSIVSPLGSSSSKHAPSHVDEALPSDRFYVKDSHADDSYYDDRSSNYSRRSWRSAAPSFAHSSVVDAYGVESPWIEDDQPEPVWQLEGSNPGPDTAVENPENGQFDFDFQAGKGGHEGAGDDDSASFYLEPMIEEESTTSIFAPDSIRDVQLYGSQPATSHSSQQWRPRLYSVPSHDLRNHDVTDSASPSEASPRVSVEQHSDVETDADDIMSPTFSAATMSSGGLNTPFRLSEGNSRTVSAYANNDDSIESVTERLRCLGSSDEDETVPQQPIIFENVETTFTRYALPPHTEEAARSAHQSPGKSSSAHDSTATANDMPFPSIMVGPGMKENTSFADSIFSALGFLGDSIA